MFALGKLRFQSVQGREVILALLGTLSAAGYVQGLVATSHWGAKLLTDIQLGKLRERQGKSMRRVTRILSHQARSDTLVSAE